MTLQLESPRLRLLPFTRDHLDFLHAHWTRPEVRRFLWDDLPIERARAAEVVEASLTSFETRDFGFWLLARRADRAEPLGFAGLKEFGASGEIELLYGLEPEAWGQGLATEAARRVIEHGFSHCGLARIWAGADPPNVASFAVMRRLGMQRDGLRLEDGREVIYYRLERP